MSSMSTRLATIGPYFAAASHEGPAEPVGPWRPMAELLDNPGVAKARVEGVRRYLAQAGRLPADAVEVRVAASVMHLGLAARTLSPLFASAVLGRRLAPLGLHDLRWQPAVGSMFELSIRGLDRVAGGARNDDAAEPEAPAGIEPIAGELCAIMQPFGVSPLILRGNVSSALNGARIALSTAVPELAADARSEFARLLHAEPLLARTASVTSDGRFRRRSCCLIYRAAPGHGGPVCGDCVLAPTRRR